MHPRFLAKLIGYWLISLTYYWEKDNIVCWILGDKKKPTLFLETGGGDPNELYISELFSYGTSYQFSLSETFLLFNFLCLSYFGLTVDDSLAVQNYYWKIWRMTSTNNFIGNHSGLSYCH